MFCARNGGEAFTGNVSKVRAADNSATSPTIALRAAALLAGPLFNSAPRLVTSGRRATISRNNPTAVMAGIASP
jgi:hypothetical protein